MSCLVITAIAVCWKKRMPGCRIDYLLLLFDHIDYCSIMLLIVASFFHPFSYSNCFRNFNPLWCQLALTHPSPFSLTPSTITFISLDAVGHLRITDFGLAKSGIKGSSSTFYNHLSKLCCISGALFVLLVDILFNYYSTMYIYQNISYIQLTKSTLASNRCETSLCKMFRSRCRGRDQNILRDTGVSCSWNSWKQRAWEGCRLVGSGHSSIRGSGSVMSLASLYYNIIRTNPTGNAGLILLHLSFIFL